LLAVEAYFTVGHRVLAHVNKKRPFMPLRGVVAARLFAVSLIAAVGFAQLSTSWHEASVRHVQCAEHGEAVDVGIVSSLELSLSLNQTTGTGIDGAGTAGTTSHDHCCVVFAFRASARAQLVRLATRSEPPPVVVRPASEPAPRPGRAYVLASAPKTSPPSA